MNEVYSENYDLLIAAIVKKASDDYRIALQKSKEIGKKTAACREVERFFKSPWGYFVCMEHSIEIMWKIRKEVGWVPAADS